MTDYPASNDSRWSPIDLLFPHLGRTEGRRTPPPGTETLAFNIGALEPLKLGGDDYAFVDGGAAAAGSTDHDYVVRDDRTAMTGDYWFERVHLLPRAGLDYGNIVTTQDLRFDLFSAFRKDNVTLTSIQINALPGMELPDMPSVPDVMGPLGSYIDPLSTNLAPLGMICRALSQGLPSFDTTVDFTLTGGIGTLYLGVEGNRIALLTADFDGPFLELLQFRTDILEHKDGTEQRISVRKNPRQIFEGRLYLTEVQRQITQALLMGWQGMTVALPVPPEQTKVTAAISAGTTDTIDVETTDDRDFRIGGLAAIIKDDTTFDVVTVLSKTATSLTFEQTIVNGYDINDKVYPVRLTVIEGMVQGRRPPVNLEIMKVRFLTIENDIGAPTASTTAFSTYNGKVLLDDCNFIRRGSMNESFEQKVTKIDNLTGIVSQNTPWEKNKRSHVKGFVVKSNSDLWDVRQLMYALRGRQVSFYIPTFMDDLTASQNLTSGVATMDISWIGYSRFIQERDPKKIFKITFTDNTSLIREVQSSSQLSATEERLTLDTTWPSDRNVSEIQRIQFYEFVRGDTDDVRIEHSTTTGRAKIFYPVKVAFN